MCIYIYIYLYIHICIYIYIYIYYHIYIYIYGQLVLTASSEPNTMSLRRAARKGLERQLWTSLGCPRQSRPVRVWKFGGLTRAGPCFFLGSNNLFNPWCLLNQRWGSSLRRSGVRLFSSSRLLQLRFRGLGFGGTRDKLLPEPNCCKMAYPPR